MADKVSSNEKGLAGRYASALYDLTVEAKSTDAVTADLTAVKSLISENDDMAMLVSSPAYSRAEQSKAIQAVLTAAKANPLTVKFVGAVAENGRLFALPQIIHSLMKLPVAMVRCLLKSSLLLHLMQRVRNL
jgi:F-type H+-transporting ATPase subunit delta